MTQAPFNDPDHRWDRWHKDAEVTSLARSAPVPKLIRFLAQPEKIEVDLARSAFVIVDMQNDFLHPEGWFAAVRGADVAPLCDPVENINRLAAGLRAVGVPIIHLNWGVRRDLSNLPANVRDKASDCGTRPAYGDAIASGRILVQGDWGAATIDAIHCAAGDLTVSKHRLSGFRDNEPDQILRCRGVTTLFYAGVNIDRCVFATLMDGAFAGYDSILVEDVCATASPAFVQDAITYLVRLLYGFTAMSSNIATAITDLQLNPETKNDPFKT